MHRTMAMPEAPESPGIRGARIAAAMASRRALLLGALAAPALARAQAFPDRPLRIIVPYPAGGTTDLLARILADRMSRPLGQAVIVENRSGAGGVVGCEVAARAPADGYTLLFGNLGPIALNPALYARLPYDPERDFTGIARVADFPLILVVPAALELGSLADFLDWAKRNRGRVNFASVGNGSVSHLAGEMLNRAAGLGMAHVPYRGGAPALTDLIAGNAQAFFATGIEAKPHLDGGRIRALAITSHDRSPVAPQLPTFRELGLAELDFQAWFGLLVPTATPAPARARLVAAVQEVMALDEVRRGILDVSAEPVRDTPEAFTALIAAEIRRWAPIVHAAGVRIE